MCIFTYKINLKFVLKRYHMICSKWKFLWEFPLIKLVDQLFHLFSTPFIYIYIYIYEKAHNPKHQIDGMLDMLILLSTIILL